MKSPCRFVFGLVVVCLPFVARAADPPLVTVRQLTHGPMHHFFGYIGQSRTTPVSGDGRFVLTLETTFQDRMPTAADAAGIGLIDLDDPAHRIEIVEQTRAWNPQQGTMFYWNPAAPHTQFFFNDRDPRTGRIFAVLYDVAARRRIAEYRFDDASLGNSGVAQQGGTFAAINYGRLARLRPVTGYPEAFDWTEGVHHPADDGVFRVDVLLHQKQLLVSFATLAQLLRDAGQNPDGVPLFINHTLWNRTGDRLFFFVRGGWQTGAARKINAPCVVHADGSHLKILKQFPGGHPEWDEGPVLIGNHGDTVVRYDVDRDEVVESLGDESIWIDAEGDKSLSADARHLVNGWRRDGRNGYTFLDRTTGRVASSPTTFDVRPWLSGDLRIDPAPCWNRTGDAIYFPALAADGTRQMFTIRVER